VSVINEENGSKEDFCLVRLCFSQNGLHERWGHRKDIEECGDRILQVRVNFACV
jgi:hypothetical protein